MAHPNRLQNARVLVFGGTSGIGYGVASMALSNGAIVTISGSAQPKADAKAAELQSLYPSASVRGVALDLSDTANLEANLKALFEKVTNGGEQKLDHIVHCAGDALFLPKIHEVSADNALQGFNVRWLTSVLIGKLLATGTYMNAATSSSFTLTGGTNTTKPMEGWSIGASWGGASEGLMRGLAVDLKPIRVNLMAPGAIDTPLFQKFVDNVGREKEAEIKKAYTLLQTWGDVRDIAEGYGWFMRDHYVTGTIASSDGGRLLK
ncbi:NAD(P)-binding protein [Paraphaeosphaeria sporulosa]|uniref:NAD(P)-binding protein n=1 Tax=Paraphaeosphaeria sporulosa TaxID=1460663 RepID=A0A177CNC1_9PLEO|nr:NAD(P)-binding protein [Paraphaeosphaeria sporulosa]OAG08786.1 NAD(P)-binding protein [Paraphaeosphaeria sporulosa]